MATHDGLERARKVQPHILLTPCFITTKAADVSSDLVAKLCMDTAPRRSAFLRYTQTKQHAKVLFRDFVVLLLNIQYTKSEPKKKIEHGK